MNNDDVKKWDDEFRESLGKNGFKPDRLVPRGVFTVTYPEDQPNDNYAKEAPSKAAYLHTNFINSVELPAVNHGVKYDGGKAPMALIPHSVMKSVAEVLAFGAVKYGADNWRKGMAWSRLISAAERHLGAFTDGTTIDEESGLNHLDHALCCLIFLRWYYDYRGEFDDRYQIDPSN